MNNNQNFALALMPTDTHEISKKLRSLKKNRQFKSKKLFLKILKMIVIDKEIYKYRRNFCRNNNNMRKHKKLKINTSTLGLICLKELVSPNLNLNLCSLYLLK